MYRREGNHLLLILIFIVLIFGLCFRGSFVPDSVATNTLINQGYSNVELVGKHWFGVAPLLSGCDQNDAVAFVAMADNPSGVRVKVLVCSGFLFKGSTIRTK